MKYLVLIWLLASLLPSCASVSRHESAISNSIGPNSIALKSQDIHAKNGVFIFRDVILDGDTSPGSWIVKGIVRNGTDRDWSKVTFNIYLYDISGNMLGGNITFFVHFLKKGFQRSFTTNYINFSEIGYPPASVSRYDIAFKEQEQQKYKFIMIKPYEDRDLYFEDKSVRIIFSISVEQIGFTISNKTNGPIKIDWNQCSYIDVNNLAHAIIHTGVRYLERDKPQVPTIIPPLAMINDVILPSDYIDYTSGAGEGWKSKPFFPIFSDDPKNNLYVGKSFGVFMPLEIDGQVRNYSFLFRIETEPL